MRRKAIVFSIKPVYAASFYRGTKRFEVRRICPNVELGSICFFYETLPVSLVTGYGVVSSTFKGKPSDLLTLINSDDSHKSEYPAYIKNATNPGIVGISKATRFETSIPLRSLSKNIVRAPQSYCHVELNHSFKL